MNPNGDGDDGGDAEDRKLFVGGLAWATTEDTITEFFGSYGSIETVSLKVDQLTGRSKGYAFVIYNDPASVDAAVAAGEQTIDGRQIQPKKSIPRQGKIFIGGLKREISEDDIKSYFSQFGNIVESE